jgi:hypothetical protein
MGYSGKTFQIMCADGGLNGSKNIDAIKPTAMLHPTRNLNLNENGRRKRGGTSHVYDAVIPDAPQIMGIYDFTLIGGTQYIISACNDGKVYKDDTNTIDTGMDTTNWFSFETFENELYIADGATTPQTWDGSAGSTSDITSVPTDWTGSNFPQQLIKHGRGVSERLWAIGFASTPGNVYASANGDGQDFSDDNTVVIAIETGDGYGVVGGVEFNDNLFAFGKRQTYVIDDTDVDTANWGYDAASWQGGVAHWRLLIKTPTDIVAMQEDGEIYSVVAAQEYGDYKAASLTRPSYMHNWIKENLRLSYISHFHGVYDPALRAIKIFCVRAGHTTVDTCLVYFIDRGPGDGWMVHENRDYDSGYSACCSALVREGEGDYQIYTGDYSGYLWKLEQTNRNDNSQAYYAGFKMPNLDMEDPRGRKNFKRGWVVMEPRGNYDLEINWWLDGIAQTAKTVSMAGISGELPFTLGTDVLGGNDIIDDDFTFGTNGKRIQLEVYNDTVDEDFFVSQILIDYKPLGREPAE